MTLLLGLDAGGTGTRARLVRAGDGRVVLDAETGSLSPAVVGLEQTRIALAELLGSLPGRPAAICIGLAGADTPERRHAVQAELERLLPEAQILAVHDARLVLAAAGLEAGIALIAGTGSVAYGRAGNQETRAGGWGHRLGDEGSGYWVVREAVRGVLAAQDAGQAPDRLAHQLIAHAGAERVEQLVERFHERAEPAFWASAAPNVLALRPDLVERAGRELACLVGTVRARLGLAGPVVLAGGLLLGCAGLAHAVEQRVGGEVRRLAGPPVAGAVRLALDLITGA